MSACPLCGSAKTSMVSSRDRLGRRVRTLLCEDCGLVFNAPGARPKALLDAYIEEERRGGPATPTPDLARSLRVLAQLEHAIPEYWPLMRDRKRVLELAAGAGEFAFVMKRLGFVIEALEPNADYAVHCSRVLGLDVHAEPFWERDYPAGAFDVIRLRHLLVHCPDPIGQLRQLREWLSDQGLLYVEIPNIEAEAATKPRGDIFDLGHTMNFNPTTLRLALASAGFVEVEETRERHRDDTVGVFRKGQTRVDLVANAGNAQRVSDAITRHYGRARAHTSIGEFVGAFAHRATEKRELKSVADHREAAERTALRVRAKLGL